MLMFYHCTQKWKIIWNTSIRGCFEWSWSKRQVGGIQLLWTPFQYTLWIYCICITIYKVHLLWLPMKMVEKKSIWGINEYPSDWLFLTVSQIGSDPVDPVVPMPDEEMSLKGDDIRMYFLFRAWRSCVDLAAPMQWANSVQAILCILIHLGFLQSYTTLV